MLILSPPPISEITPPPAPTLLAASSATRKSISQITVTAVISNTVRSRLLARQPRVSSEKGAMSRFCGRQLLLLGWIRSRTEPAFWFTCKMRQEILMVVVGGMHADTHFVAWWNVLTADSVPPGPASRQNAGPLASHCPFLDVGA